MENSRFSFPKNPLFEGFLGFVGIPGWNQAENGKGFGIISDILIFLAAFHRFGPSRCWEFGIPTVGKET